MPIVFTGSKTVTKDLSPYLTAAKLTTLLAIAPELLTVGQLRELHEATKKKAGGGEPTAVLGDLFA
jgi:hypothetical protein